MPEGAEAERAPVVAVEPARVIVAAGRGAVAMDRLQPAGKSCCRVRVFLNGYRVQPGERFGPE